MRVRLVNQGSVLVSLHLSSNFFSYKLRYFRYRRIQKKNLAKKTKEGEMVNPHVLVIPYPAQGHVIPLFELSRCLVKHSIEVTFVNTEHVHMQMKNALAMEDEIGSKIHHVFISDGLESVEDRKIPGKFSAAIMQVMPGKFEELIEEINGANGDQITCVLADQSLGWALEIADQKAIKRAAFCPAAAALLVLGFSIPKLIDEGIVANDGE